MRESTHSYKTTSVRTQTGQLFSRNLGQPITIPSYQQRSPTQVHGIVIGPLPLTHLLVIDVEVDVEQVPDEDHGPELQRPWNAVGDLGFSARVRRRRPRGRRRRRPRPRRSAACREQGRR